MRNQTQEERHNYTYERQDQLKLLISLLAENSLELSVNMKAVVPREFDALIERILREKQMDTDAVRALAPEGSIEERYAAHREVVGNLLEELAKEAERLKVFPFTSLSCLFPLYWGPDIKHTFPYHFKGHKRIDELYFRLLASPLALLRGWRFHSIWMEDARDGTNIRVVKDTAVNTPEDQYIITSVYAGLNPRDWGGGCSYTSGTDYDAHLSAENGIITVSGVNIEKVVLDLVEKIGVREKPKELEA